MLFLFEEKVGCDDVEVSFNSRYRQSFAEAASLYDSQSEEQKEIQASDDAHKISHSSETCYSCRADDKAIELDVNKYVKNKDAEHIKKVTEGFKIRVSRKHKRSSSHHNRRRSASPVYAQSGMLNGAVDVFKYMSANSDNITKISDTVDNLKDVCQIINEEGHPVKVLSEKIEQVEPNDYLQAIKDATQAANDINSTLIKHGTSVEKILKDTQTFTESLTKTLSYIKDMGSFKYKKIAIVAGGVIGMALTLYYIKDPVARAMIMTGVTLGMAKYTSVVSKIKDIIDKMTSKKEIIVAETLEGEYLHETIAQLFTSMFTKRSPNDMKIDGIRANRLNGVVKMVSNIKDLLSFVGDSILVGLNSAFECAFGYPIVLPEDKPLHDKVVAFIEKAQVYVSQLEITICRSLNAKNVIKQLAKEKDDLIVELTDKRKYTAQMAFFFKIAKNIEDIYLSIENFEQTDNGRMEPLCGELIGAPGVGKTMALNCIVADILSLIDDKESKFAPLTEYGKFNGNSIYPRNVGQEFWDGYKHQFCTVYDDYMQIKDDESSKSFAAEFFKVINNCAYNLNMANLSSKGNTYFDSPMVVLTSNSGKNVAYERVFSLQSAEAFLRRRDFLVKVSIAEDYVEDADKPIDRDRWVYTFCDHKGNEVRSVNHYVFVVVLTKMILDKFNRSNYVRILREQPLTAADIKSRVKQLPKIVTKTGKASATDIQNNIMKCNTYVDNLYNLGLDKIDEFLQPIMAQCGDCPKNGRQHTRFLTAAIKFLDDCGKNASIGENDFIDITVKLVERGDIKKLVSNDSMVALLDHIAFMAKLRDKRDVTVQDRSMVTCTANALDSLHYVITFEKNNSKIIADIVDKLLKFDMFSMTADDEGNLMLRSFIVSAKPSFKEIITQAAKTFQMNAKSVATYISKVNADHPIKTIFVGLVGAFSIAALVGYFGMNLLRKKDVEEDTNEDVQEKVYQTSAEPQTSEEYISALGKIKAKHGYTSKKLQKLTYRSQNFGPRRGMQQAAFAQSSEQSSIHDLVKKNVISIEGVNSRIRTAGLGLCDNYFITVKHFFDILDPNDQLIIEWPGHKKTYPINLLGDWLILVGYDILLIKICDKSTPKFKDITHHIARRDELPNMLYKGVSMITPTKIVTSREADIIKTLEYTYNHGCEQRKYYNIECIRSGILSNSGDCGSPVIVESDRAPRRLVGIHIAGSATKAYASVLTYEMVTTLIEEIETQATSVMSKRIDHSVFDLEGTYCLGAVPKGEVPFVPNKTSFERSGLIDIYSSLDCRVPEEKTIPALLKWYTNPNGEVIKPYEIALKKKLCPSNYFTDEAFDDVLEFFKNYYPVKFPNRLLTLEESINGLEGSELLGPWDFNTSLGYPFITHKTQVDMNIASTKKSEVVSLLPNGKRIISNKKFLARYLDQLKKVKSTAAELPDCIIVDILKDEPIPIEKMFDIIDGEYYCKGKTRIMGPTPFDILLLERQYFGAFYVNTLAIREEGGFCDVGMNPHCMEFDNYVRSNLGDPDDYVVLAGDISGLDGHIKERLHDAFLEIVEHFYKGAATEEDKVARLKLNIVLGKAVKGLVEDVLYITSKNPSGKFLTTVLNSTITSLIILYAAYTKRGLYSDMEYVAGKMRTYGDDHIVFIHKKDLFLTMEDLKQAFAKFGMLYTGYEKDKDMPLYYEFKDAKYLGREFQRDKAGKYHLALSKETIDQFGFWKKDSTNDKEYFEQCAQAAIIESYHWGYEYFMEVQYRWNKVLNCLGYKPNCLTYKGLHSAFLGIGVCANNYIMAQSGKTDETSFVKITDRGERAATVSDETSTTLLTTFDDTVDNQVDLTAPIDITPVHVGSDPYTSSTLDKVLSRTYPIGTLSWVHSDGVGTLLGTYSFPHDLLNPTILDRMVHYQFFRAGIEVSIRLNTTMFHSGLLMVSYLPHYPEPSVSTVFDKLSNMWAASGNNVMTISANTQETVTFRIPYIAPSAYWDMDQTTEGYGFFATVKIFVLYPLLSGVGATPTVDVSVFARFVDPQVAAPIHVQSSTLKGKNKTVEKEQEIRSSNGVISDIARAGGSIAYAVGATTVGKVLDTFSDITSKTGIFGRFLINMPTSVQATSKMTINSGSNFSFITGLDNSSILGLEPTNMVSTDPSMHAQRLDYNLFKNYKKLPMLLRVDSIDSTTAAGAVFYRQQVNPMSAYSETVPGPITTYQPTHIGNLASYFGAWRGDMRYMIQFVCSRFLSCRIRIDWVPNPLNTSVTTSLEQSGNNINKIVDVNGDTVVCFAIPYLRKEHWLRRVNYNDTISDFSLGSNGTFRMSIVNPVVSAQPSEVTTIGIVTWVSGGDSFQVAYPCNINSALQPVIWAQSGIVSSYLNVRDAFECEFQGLNPMRLTQISGLEIGEDCVAFSELMHRYEYLSNFPITGSSQLQTTAYMTALDTRRWYRILQTFMFIRGSVRYKYVSQSLTGLAGMTTSAFDQPTYGLTGAEGMIYQTLQINPVMEAQVPFYYAYPFYAHELFLTEVGRLPEVVVANGTSSTISGNLFVASGDDFTLSWPCAPMALQFSNL